eukprot:953883-Pleurochrysis_carterae.AAC.1
MHSCIVLGLHRIECQVWDATQMTKPTEFRQIGEPSLGMSTYKATKRTALHAGLDEKSRTPDSEKASMGDQIMRGREMLRKAAVPTRCRVGKGACQRSRALRARLRCERPLENLL